MLKKFLWGLVLFLFLFLGIGLLLPTDYDVERTVTIEAPAEVVLSIAGDLRTWPEWTAWGTQKDPEVHFTFEGVMGEPGSSYSWRGPTMGTGTLTLIDLGPVTGVSYTLSVEEGRFEAQGGLSFHDGEQDGLLIVAWRNQGELGRNPLYRWLGLVIQRGTGADFEEGLAGLKAAAESKARSAKSGAALADSKISRPVMPSESVESEEKANAGSVQEEPSSFVTEAAP